MEAIEVQNLDAGGVLFPSGNNTSSILWVELDIHFFSPKNYEFILVYSVLFYHYNVPLFFYIIFCLCIYFC